MYADVCVSVSPILSTWHLKKTENHLEHSVLHLRKHWVSTLLIHFLIGFFNSSFPEELETPILSSLYKSL